MGNHEDEPVLTPENSERLEHQDQVATSTGSPSQDTSDEQPNDAPAENLKPTDAVSNRAHTETKVPTPEQSPHLPLETTPTPNADTPEALNEIITEETRTNPDQHVAASTPSWLYPGNSAPPQAPGRAAAHTNTAKRESRRGTLAAAIAAGAITGILAGTAASVTTERVWNSDSLNTASKVHIADTPQTDSVAANWVTSVSSILQPSVVSVIATRNGIPMSTGSGVVLTDDGHIMTNAHVVSGADQVSIRLSDASTLPATISGADTIYDIAVVKVDRTLPAATFNLEPVQVGEPVAAFGAPLGLYGTVTVGIVSAVARPVTAGDGSGETSIVSAVQTDAAVNPGNSGGPLVNVDGEVVGVNSSIATLSAGPGSGSIGLGFAIPSSTAVRVASELADRGYAERPLVGVSIGPASQFGARIDGLTTGGPAEAAGVLVGDILTAVDGVQAESPVAAIALIRSAEPGKTIRLTVLRNDSLIDIEVVSQAERGPLRTEPTPNPVPSPNPAP